MKIGIILRCNPWAVGWSPEGTFYGFGIGKILKLGQNPKIWVRCLFEGFSISDFGGKWPLKWKFSKMSPDSATGHRTTFRDQSLWKAAVAKLPKGPLHYHTKNSGSVGLVPAPILPKMGRSRPKFPERCHPLTCPHRPNLVRIGCALPDLFPKDWFFGRKSKYSIGFQPTVMDFYSVFRSEDTEAFGIMAFPTNWRVHR